MKEGRNRRFPRRLIASRKSTLIHEVARQLAHAAAETVDASIADDDLPKDRLLNLDGVCEYCEKRKAVTTDHFVPLVRGKRPSTFCNDTWNSVPSCKECNSAKGGKKYDEWLLASSNLDVNAQVSIPRFALLQTLDAQHRARHAWRKFAAFEIAAHLRRRRTRAVDDDWWEATTKMISEFVEDLQSRVDAHSAKESALANDMFERGLFHDTQGRRRSCRLVRRRQ